MTTTLKLEPYKHKANAIEKYSKSPTPSRDKHNRINPRIQKNNKTFWSSGVENSINIPRVVNKDITGSPSRGGRKEKEKPMYKQLGRPTVDITEHEKKQMF